MHTVKQSPSGLFRVVFLTASEVEIPVKAFISTFEEAAAICSHLNGGPTPVSQENQKIEYEYMRLMIGVMKPKETEGSIKHPAKAGQKYRLVGDDTGRVYVVEAFVDMDFKNYHNIDDALNSDYHPIRVVNQHYDTHILSMCEVLED